MDVIVDEFTTGLDVSVQDQILGEATCFSILQHPSVSLVRGSICLLGGNSVFLGVVAHSSNNGRILDVN